MDKPLALRAKTISYDSRIVYSVIAPHIFLSVERDLSGIICCGCRLQTLLRIRLDQQDTFPDNFVHGVCHASLTAFFFLEAQES